MLSAGDSMAFVAVFWRDSLRIIPAVADILQHGQNLVRHQVPPFPMPSEYRGRTGSSENYAESQTAQTQSRLRGRCLRFA
jgi:hypothetical protein